MTPDEADAAFNALMEVVRLLETQALDVEMKLQDSHKNHNYPAAWAELIASGVYTEIAGEVEILAKKYARTSLGIEE